MTVTVTVVLELAVTVLPGPLIVIVLLRAVVTTLAGPLSPGVKFWITPGVLVKAAGEAALTGAVPARALDVELHPDIDEDGDIPTPPATGGGVAAG